MRLASKEELISVAYKLKSQWTVSLRKIKGYLLPTVSATPSMNFDIVSNICAIARWCNSEQSFCTMSLTNPPTYAASFSSGRMSGFQRMF